MESHDAGAEQPGQAARRGRERSEQLIARAVRLVAAIEGVGEDAARRSLRETAVRAGVSEREIARGVVLFHTPEHPRAG